jgi:hypothetical protein
MTIRVHRFLETTAPLVHTCRRCERPVIYGLAEGLPARVDPAPLDGPLAEALAVVAGRETYTLTRIGLVQRDAVRRSDPSLTGPVVAQHDCPRRNS